MQSIPFPIDPARASEQITAILESLADAFYVLDRAWRFTYVNANVEPMLQKTREELLGKSLWEVYPKAVGSAFHQKLTQALTQQVRMESEEFSPLLNAWFAITACPFEEGLYVYIRDITHYKRAQEQIHCQVERLMALRATEIGLISSLDIHKTLSIVLDQVTTTLGVQGADILLLHSETQALEYAVGRGFKEDKSAFSPLAVGEGMAGRAVLAGQIVGLLDIGEGECSARAELMERNGFVDYCAIPLMANGEVMGVLEIYHHEALPLDGNWWEFLEALSSHAAIAIYNATLLQNLQRSNQELIEAYDTTIEGWSHALDLRDKETEGHSRRVTELSVRLAKAMGISRQELLTIRWGALLHDVGKLGVRDAILLKPDKLTEEERAEMEMHPTYAYRMLSSITYLRSALDIPYCHHEKWDGTGYPRGLKGEEIPFSARIFAIVDVWDALCSDRPYRKGWSKRKVCEHLRSLSGTHFDPQVVEAFLTLLNAEDASEKAIKKAA